jgi:hypothetical protein
MHRILCFLFIAITVAPARADKTALDALVALEQKVRAARDKGDDATMLQLLQQMLAIEMPPKLRDYRGRLNHSVACIHGRAGRAEAAMSALEAATRTGWTQADHTMKDADLALIRTMPRFRAALDEMRRNQIRLRVYEVQTWDNPDLPPDLPRFDRTDSQAARDLRQRYALDTLVDGAPDQLTAQKAVLAWVHNRWAHSGLNEPVKPNALDILKAVEGGARFRCVEYSIVLAQALNALGHPARVVGLRQDGMSYGTGKGHVITEAWNDDLGRWIALDGQNNAVWTYQGEPQSAHQVRRLRQSGKAVRLEHGGSTWMKTPPDQDTWLAYFHAIRLVTDNRIFDAPADVKRSAHLLITPDMQPELLFQGAPQPQDITMDVAASYPVLNRVHVQLTPEGGTLKCALRHAMPNFARYDINGVATSSPDYAWSLQPGPNTLEVRAVNERGVKGRATRFTVVYHPRQ